LEKQKEPNKNDVAASASVFMAKFILGIQTLRNIDKMAFYRIFM
jgi:hypothetical protein